MSTRRMLISILSATVLAVCLFSTQNCSGPASYSGSTSTATTATTAAMSGGNGDVHEGKPYFEMTSGTPCPDGNIFRAEIIVYSATRAELVRDNCQTLGPINLASSDIQVDPLRPDYLIYSGRTFVSQPAPGLWVRSPLSYDSIYFPGGQVGIGTNSPIAWSKLDVAGDMHVSGGLYAENDLRFKSNFTGTFSQLCQGTGSGWNIVSFCPASSGRYKSSVQDLRFGLQEVTKLRPVTFHYKPEYSSDGSEQMGFIAEEVEKVSPQLVIYKNGHPENVKYDKMSALLVSAIKEQKREFDALKAQNIELKSALCEQNPQLKICAK